MHTKFSSPHVRIASSRRRVPNVNMAGVCVFSHLERDLDVRLRAEVVDLRRLHLRDDVDEVGAVAEVAVVQLELVGA